MKWQRRAVKKQQAGREREKEQQQEEEVVETRREDDHHLLPRELSTITINAKIVPPIKQQANVIQKQTL